MRYATFINFTEKEFTAYWNGRPYTFKPGQKKEHLNEAIARHFAKHLTNQYLQDPDNGIVNGEKYTSPKKPNEVPVFMEAFNQAFIIEGDGDEVDAETGLPADGQNKPAEAGLPDEPSMDIKTKPREVVDPYDANAQKDNVGPGGAPNVVATLETDEAPPADEKTEEDNFEGKEKEEDKK